jgi:hypothetical protein
MKSVIAKSVICKIGGLSGAQRLPPFANVTIGGRAATALLRRRQYPPDRLVTIFGWPPD